MKPMLAWWAILLFVCGLGVVGLARVRGWDSREEFMRVVGFGFLLVAVGVLFLLWSAAS